MKTIEQETNRADAITDIVGNAQAPSETLQDAIARLSLLPALEYDQVREQEAIRLNVRKTTLDSEVKKYKTISLNKKEEGALFQTIEPWHEPVDPDELLNDIRALVKYYIVCNTETAIATTLWIAFTWFIDQVQVAPIAMITAPEKRCGKSQLLSLMSQLSARPLMASNISPSAIFRIIEAHSPTLLIDEADTFLRENEEARGIINSGHTRSSAYIIRNVGDNHEPKQFSTWGAKAICGIGKQADTLMDRSVVLELRRKLPHESVQRLRYADPIQFDVFKSRLARFSADMGDIIKAARPALPEALNDRAQDNWEPLLAIADCAGGDWPRLARNAALKISGKEEDSASISVELLQDIKEIFEEYKYLKVKSRDLIERLCEDDMKPWGTYNRGKPITPRQVAKRLSEYGIEPKTIRISGTAKGYEKAQFEDAFVRYIPTPSSTLDLSVTTEQNITKPYGEKDRTVTDSENVTVTQNKKVTLQPTEHKGCYGVTDKKGVSGSIHSNEEVF